MTSLSNENHSRITQMDVSLISGAVTSLKTAFDIAKEISDLKSMTDVQGKVIELQQATKRH